MSAAPVSRRTFLVGTAVAAGSAALPLSPVAAAPVVEATGQAVTPAVEFFRYGVSLNGGQPRVFAPVLAAKVLLGVEAMEGLAAVAASAYRAHSHAKVGRT